MKKILLTAVLVLSVVTIRAQVHYGVKGGFNFAKLHSEFNNDSSDGLTSFYAGGLTEFSLGYSNKFKGQVELLYAQNGTKRELRDDYDGYTEEVKISLGEIMMPIFLKYNAYEGLYINGGVYLGTIISAKEKWEREGEDDSKDEYKTFDAGLLFGAEYNFSNNIFVDLRYNLGMLDILEADTNKVHNRIFNLGIGYKF